MGEFDLIVIGAGVLGTFHAYFAAQQSLKTLLIERNAMPNDASVRNFGILAQSLVHPSSPEADLARATRDIYHALQSRCDISLRVPGSIYLASTNAERAVLHEYAAAGGSDSCVFLEKVAVTARYPFIQESNCLGALLFPDDMTIEPRRMLTTLIPFMVETTNVEYRPFTTVIAVEQQGERCVVRDIQGDTYAAEHVVVCSGAEYRTLFPAAFQDSGLQVCKLQMMQTVIQPSVRLPHVVMSGLSIRRYPAFSSCSSYPALLGEPVPDDLKQYGIHVLIKQAADGSVIIGDSHEYNDTAAASTLEERTSVTINDAILDHARRMIRLPTWSMAELWNGYYPVHPRQDIFTLDIDQHITFVLGSGKGMTLGPGFARQHVESLVGRQAHLERE